MPITPSTRRRIAALRGPKRCNCVFWAWTMLRRRRPHARLGAPAGYLSGRQSFFATFVWHLFYSRNQRVWWAYVPFVHAWKPQDIWMPWRWGEILWFRGHIVLGDGAALAEHDRVLLIAETALRLRICPKG